MMQNAIHRLAFLLLVSPLASFAQLTTIASYAGGENDFSPVNGGLVSLAVDGSGNANDLLSEGAPRWSSLASPGSAAYDSGAPSTFSYYFDGSSSMSISPPLTSALNNWGMETWVRLDNTIGIQIFMLNGEGGNGYGLVLLNGRWNALLGGVGYMDGSAASINTWTHLALVNDEGVNEFFINGTSVASDLNIISQPMDQFSLGKDPSDNFMTGYLDQARLFTFTGNFNPASLNLSSIPEPATFTALAGLAALGLAATRRRRAA